MVDVAWAGAAGPLAGYGRLFVEMLESRGYQPGSARFRVALFAQFSQWIGENGVALGELDWEVVDRYLEWRHSLGGAGALPATRGGMRIVVDGLVAFGAVGAEQFAVPCGPVLAGGSGDVVGRWTGFLVDRRGLKQETARGYAVVGRAFLETVLAPGGRVDWGRVDADAVEGFVVRRAESYARKSVAAAAVALRSLLSFAFGQGWTPRDWGVFVPQVPESRLAGLPRGLEEGQVERLVASIRVDRRGGFRDRAIVLMLARMGLRCAEVAHLMLEDIDWRAGVVRVAGKGRKVRLMPLPWDVGQALVEYLKTRPDCEDRSVFVRSHAPVTRFGPGAVSLIVSQRARRAGLDGFHAHRLRHTAATAVLARGGSLEEAGQLLGHASTTTTMIYAKVDTDALRALAVPWPGVLP